MEFTQTQKYILTSPKKLREVASVIKKMSPRDAVDQLPFLGKRAGESIRKVIMTALANARQKNVSEDTLSIKELQIMEGPRLKRFRAGARGRAKPYKKRMSHIKIVLTTEGFKKETPVKEDLNNEKKENLEVKPEKQSKTKKK